MAEAHRFAHNHGQELQFHDGRVAPDRLARPFLVICPPFDIFKGVAIGNGTGRMVVLFLQPECQPLPVAGVAFQRARAVAVPLQILRHPCIPTATADFTGTAVEFFGFKLRAQGACLHGFAGIVRPQAGGFVAPYAVGVNKLNEPERRVLFFVNRCHNSVQFVQ